MGIVKFYSHYKSVDLFWLKNIPDHWQTRKVKHLFAERVEKGCPEKQLLAATQTKGVVTKELYENRTVLAQKDLHLLKLVKVGDFVISLRSFQGGIEHAYYEGIISPAYTIMDPNSNISNGYFRHLAKSKAFLELLKQCVTGIREGQNIDYSVLKNSLIPHPPKEEQDQIARYLDSKLAKINKFIRNKKRLIELLKEQKQAVINQAVTKGLDPDAKMKPSGVEWLGDVPEGWVKEKVNRLFSKIGSGTTPASGNQLYYLDGSIPWINSGDLNDAYLENTKNRITKEALRTYSVLKMFPPDTIVIALYGATIGKLSITRIEACCNQACCCLSGLSNRLNLKYAFYVLIVSRTHLIELSRGGGQPNVNQEIMRQTWFPCPPISEQLQVVSYIEAQSKIIDQTIDRIKKEIDLITEYRTSLISAVVTGKIDVRGIEVEEPPAEDLAALEPAELEAEELREDDLWESVVG